MFTKQSVYRALGFQKLSSVKLTWQSTIGFGMLDGIRPTLQLSNAWISIASIFDECGRVFPSCSWTSWTKENLSTFIEKSKTVFKYCEYLFADSFMFCYKCCCWSATSAMVQNISAAGVTTWDGWYEKSKFPIFKVNAREIKSFVMLRVAWIVWEIKSSTMQFWSWK